MRTDRTIVEYAEVIARITRLPDDGDGDYVAHSNGLIDVSAQTAISSLTARWKDWWRNCIRAHVKDT